MRSARAVSAFMLARRSALWILAGVAVALGAAAPASAAAKRFVSTARSGGSTLTVTGTIKKDQVPIYENMTMTLRAPGGAVLRKNLFGAAGQSWGYRPVARLADVSGDGRPDALVDTFSGGAHCCSVATITVSKGKSGWAAPFRQLWDGGYRLRDLGKGDGVYEIVAVDQRFDYLFASHAESARPVTIERATTDGKLIDVAKEFPDRLRVDANFWLGEWQKLGPVAGESTDDAQARGYASRSTLAATLAVLLQLGALDEAKALAAQSVARGDFTNLETGVDKIFSTDVAHELQKMGFLTDWSVLGLPE